MRKDVNILLADAGDDIRYKAAVDGYRSGYAGGPKCFEMLLDEKACKLPDGAEAFCAGRRARLLEKRSGSLAGTLHCYAVVGFTNGYAAGRLDQEDGEPPRHFPDAPETPRGWWATWGHGYFNGEGAV